MPQQKIELPILEFRQDSTKERDKQWNHYESKESVIRFSSGQFVPFPNFFATFQTYVTNCLQSTMMPNEVFHPEFSFIFFIGIIPCVEFHLSWYACNLMTGEWSKINPDNTNELYAMYDSLMKTCELEAKLAIWKKKKD